MIGRKLKCGARILDLGKVRVMGILNVTPDSFSDGGRYETAEKAIVRAQEMVDAGASIIDIGGESTRPGARAVGIQEEMDRVCPVIELVSRRLDTIVSVDTSTPEVMAAAIRLGAGFINDVRALEGHGALEMAAELGVPVCLMHMRGAPQTMQEHPEYADVVADVHGYLVERAAVARSAGIDSSRIVLDPGFGFGKTLAHNLALLSRLEEFADLNYPLLIGISRKSMIGQLLGLAVDDRLSGSLAAAVIAAMKGAVIVRVHDVRETAQAVSLVNAVGESRR